MGAWIPVDPAVLLCHHGYGDPGLPGPLPEDPGDGHHVWRVTTALGQGALCDREKQRTDGRIRKRIALVRAGNRRKNQQGDEGNRYSDGHANHILD